MWIPNDIIASVDEIATIHYVDMQACQAWNQHRREGEIRLLTGWVWTAKVGGLYQQGLKTKTQCYRDAYYRLVLKTIAPSLNRRMIRRVA
jgi:hypothetical protein